MNMQETIDFQRDAMKTAQRRCVEIAGKLAEILEERAHLIRGTTEDPGCPIEALQDHLDYLDNDMELYRQRLAARASEFLACNSALRLLIGIQLNENK